MSEPEVPAVSGLGKPVTLIVWAAAGWTTMFDSVPLRLEVHVSVAVIHWLPTCDE